MRERRSGFLSEALWNQANVLEVIFIAIFIAFGVNLAAGSVPVLTRLTPIWSLSIGILVCLLSVAYFLLRSFGGRTRLRKYEAFFVYDVEKNHVIPVPRYGFSTLLSAHLKAAFLEDKALKLIWDAEPLRQGHETLEKERKNRRSLQLVCEATEYLVLRELSSHLSVYFSDSKFKEHNLREFQRDDMPDVLLKNRFMELLSRPPEDRIPFMDDPDQRSDVKVIGILGKDGAIYEHFTLVLPKDTTVRRIEKHSVKIATRRLAITITVGCNAWDTFIPDAFGRHYLHIDDYDITRHRALAVNVTARVEFRLGALFSPTGWEYYRWLDSFLDKLNDMISAPRFFERIGWESALTTVGMLAGRDKDHANEPRSERGPAER